MRLLWLNSEDSTFQLRASLLVLEFFSALFRSYMLHLCIFVLQARNRLFLDDFQNRLKKDDLGHFLKNTQNRLFFRRFRCKSKNIMSDNFCESSKNRRFRVYF